MSDLPRKARLKFLLVARDSPVCVFCTVVSSSYRAHVTYTRSCAVYVCVRITCDENCWLRHSQARDPGVADLVFQVRGKFGLLRQNCGIWVEEETGELFVDGFSEWKIWGNRLPTALRVGATQGDGTRGVRNWRRVTRNLAGPRRVQTRTKGKPCGSSSPAGDTTGKGAPAPGSPKKVSSA